MPVVVGSKTSIWASVRECHPTRGGLGRVVPGFLGRGGFDPSEDFNRARRAAIAQDAGRVSLRYFDHPVVGYLGLAEEVPTCSGSI
jgi:hypothetical protein